MLLVSWKDFLLCLLYAEIRVQKGAALGEGGEEGGWK